MTFTGDHKRTEGPCCRTCRSTEARCARVAGCCGNCSHWRAWTPDGEPIVSSTSGRPLAPVVDEVTAKRREQWRARYRQRRAS